MEVKEIVCKRVGRWIRDEGIYVFMYVRMYVCMHVCMLSWKLQYKGDKGRCPLCSYMRSHMYLSTKLLTHMAPGRVLYAA